MTLILIALSLCLLAVVASVIYAATHSVQVQTHDAPAPVDDDTDGDHWAAMHRVLTRQPVDDDTDGDHWAAMHRVLTRH